MILIHCLTGLYSIMKAIMKTNIRFLIPVTLAIILACGTQPYVPSASTPTQALVVLSNSPEPPESQLASTQTPADQPTAVPTVPGGVTDTPLPPLPDFQQLVTFGIGGGGGPGPCAEYQNTAPAIVVLIDQSAQSAILCLSGVLYDRPFQLKLISPDGRSLQSNNIRLNQATGDVEWSGYQGFFASADSTGGSPSMTLSIWWPNSLPAGQWHISASSNGFQAESDFSVERTPGIVVLDTGFGNEIIPSTERHRHPFKANGHADVLGLNYPAHTPVYVLLYHQLTPIDFALVDAQAIVSDGNGSISTELAGPFESNANYMLVGITDPHTELGNYLFGYHLPYPYDYFQAVPSTASMRPPSYTLQPGEFPYCIARRFNVNPNELLILNGLTTHQPLYSGRVLQIPQSGNPFPGDRSLQYHPVFYTVSSSKQTLGSVACQFGDVDPLAIASNSGISPTASLFTGQQLNIP